METKTINKWIKINKHCLENATDEEEDDDDDEEENLTIYWFIHYIFTLLMNGLLTGAFYYQTKMSDKTKWKKKILLKKNEIKKKVLNEILQIM